MHTVSFVGKFFLLVCAYYCLLLHGALPINAQTEQVLRGNGPFSGRAKSIVTHNRQIFVVVTDAESYTLPSSMGTQTIVQSGIYRSADNGGRWSVVQFPAPALASSLFSHGNFLYVLTSASGLQLYRSRDDGASWEAISTGVVPAVTHLVAFGDTLFARTGLETRISAMYVSVDSGKVWTLVSSPGSIGSVVASRSRVAATQGRSLLFGGSPSGLLRSTNRGVTWQPVPTTPSVSNITVFDVATKANDELFLATNQGVLSSTDNGQSWRSFNAGLEGKTIRSIIAIGDTLLAAANDGVYLNAGSAWQILNTGFPNPTLETYSLLLNENQNTTYVGTESGVFSAGLSANRISAWQAIHRGLPGARIEQLAMSGNVLLAASPTVGMVRSVGSGAWMQSNTGLPTNAAITQLAISPSSSVAVTSTKTALFVSSNTGSTWRSASINLGSNEITSLGNTSVGTSASDRFLVGTLSGSIFRSNDNSAQTWSRVTANPLEGLDVKINGFLQSSTTTYCATNEGLLLSTDAASSWSRASETIFPRVPVFSLATAGGLLLAGTNDGVYRSLDGGRSWLAPQTSARIGTVVSLAVRYGLVYSGTATDGVYRSSDNGATWQKLAIADLSAVRALLTDSTRLIIGAPNGIYEYTLPSPLEFPRISSLLPSDSVLVGLTDAVLTIAGANFSTSASVVVSGQTLVPQSASATQIVVRIPVALLQTVSTVTVEVVNGVSARTSTSLRVVPLPENFPRLSITAALEPFTAFITQASAVQRYTLSGTNVRDSVVVQVPQGFELSSDSGRTWLSGARVVFAPSASFSREFSVRFRPLFSQNISGFITHSIGGVVLQSLAVSGLPKSLQLEISSNGAIDFGATRLGLSLPSTITLVNPNPISITVATIFTGINAADFTASVQQIVIAPMGRANVSIIFSPRGRGEREGIVTFSGLASGQLSLRGKGVQAVLTLSQNEVQFSTTAFVGQTQRLPAEIVRISNIGDVEDVVTGFSITTETGASVSFRVRNFSPLRLEAGSSALVTIEFAPENMGDAAGLYRATLKAQTQNAFTSSATLRLQGKGQVLEPPVLTLPRSGGAALGNVVSLQWASSVGATHYEVALDEAANSQRLLNRIVSLSSLTSATVSITQNKTYYWTVRSLAVSGADTLVRSAWQQWRFFSSASESRVVVPPVLDFGVITQEQIESPPRGQPVTIVSGSWRVQDVSIVQEDNLPQSDFRAFRILNRETLLGSGALLRASAESYTIAVSFRPPEPRVRPYSAVAELRLQNTSTGEVLIIPFQLLARSAKCPLVRAGSIGNQGCPEAVLRVQILPNKAVFAPGDDIRLQIQLVQVHNLAPNLDRFMRQLRLTLDVQNITLFSFPNRLSAGTAAQGDASVRAVSYTAASGSSSGASGNTDGKIHLDLIRHPNALQNVVLGELTGKAVIGLQGLGASAEESIVAATIRFSDVQWLSDTREVLDSGQVITWGNERGVPITQQNIVVTVNTCQTEPGTLVLAEALPVSIKPLAPNPVQDETTITFTLQQQGWTELELINGFGQSLKKIVQATMFPGEYSVRCSVADLPSGSYFLVLRTPFETVQQRLEVVR